MRLKTGRVQTVKVLLSFVVVSVLSAACSGGESELSDEQAVQVVDLDASDVIMTADDLSGWDTDDSATAASLTAFTGICFERAAERIGIEIPDSTSNISSHYQQPFGAAYLTVSARTGAPFLDRFFDDMREGLAACENQEIGGARGTIVEFEAFGDETLAYSFDRRQYEALWVAVRKDDVLVTVRYAGLDEANILFVEQSLSTMLSRIPEGREAVVAQLQSSADEEATGSGSGSDDVESEGAESSGTAGSLSSTAVFARHSAAVLDIAELPDGRVVSVDDDSIAWVWDPADPEGQSVSIRAPGADLAGAYVGGFSAVAALADGRLVTAGRDCSDTDPANCSRPNYVLHFWDPARPTEILASYRDHDSSVRSLNTLSDGRLAVGGTRRLSLLEPDDLTASPVRFAIGTSRTVEMNDGRLAASGRQTAVWDLRTVERVDLNSASAADAVYEHHRSATAVAQLPEGRIASGMENGWVHMWRTDDPQAEPVIYSGQDDAIVALALLDADHIASASLDGTVHIWDPNVPDKDNAFVDEQHLGPINSMIRLSSGLLATASDDGTVRVWDPSEAVGPLDPDSISELAVDPEALAARPEVPEVIDILIERAAEPADVPEAPPVAISPIAAGPPESERFGEAVALSGSTLAVAATDANRDGRVDLYLRDSDEWLAGPTLLPPVGDSANGFGVALSLEGALLAVGADTTFDPSATRFNLVHLYTGADQEWDYTDTIEPVVDERRPTAGFGEFSTLADGLLLSATKPNRGTRDSGSILGYARDGDTWEEVFRLVSSNDEAMVDHRDGRIAAIVGGQKVEVLDQVGEEWFETAEIRMDFNGSFDLVKLGDGYVALADGDRLWIVWLDGDSRGTVQTLAPEFVRRRGFGSPALVIDGDYLVYKKSRQGEILLFERSGSQWVSVALVELDWDGRDVGDSIDLDGGYLVVGAPEESVVLGGSVAAE